MIWRTWSVLALLLLGHPGQPVESDLIEPYIVGGVQAGKNEFPYVVAILEYGRHYCGGVIYNTRYIITAAHCVYSIPIVALTIVAGEHDLKKNDGTEQVRQIKNKIIFPYFNALNYRNDIALLELTSPLSFNAAVGSLKLFEKGQLMPGVGTAIGWGRTTMGGLKANVLRKVSVPIQADEICKRNYGKLISDKMFCAGFNEGGKDSCRGDSGGPFVIGNRGNQYLAGIISWGNGCALSSYPGVYTKVSEFLDFIKEKTFK